MIIKPWTERNEDITALATLIDSSALKGSLAQKAQIQLLKLKAGTMGERAAAYEIDRLFGNDPDYAVIHDLRLDHGGHVAQIDHLVITRSLHGLLLETKNFSEGLGCNDFGEWVGFYKNKPFGIASPIHQSERQRDILDDFLTPGHSWIPKRIGEYIALRTTPFVIISNTARISRPNQSIKGMENVFKIEALKERGKAFEDSIPYLVKKIRKISSEQLKTFAEGLASQHKPHITDWQAAFGVNLLPDIITPSPSLPRISTATPPAPQLPIQSTHAQQQLPIPIQTNPTGKKKIVCDSCGVIISLAEGRYCWTRKERFGENVYCRSCQHSV